MSAFNSIMLIGRITNEIEPKQVGESKVVNFSIAVDRPVKDDKGEKITDFFRITAWNKLADIIAEYGDKGRLVLVSGRLENRSYEKDGQKHTVSEVRCEQFQLLDSKKSSSKSSGMPASESTYVKDIKIEPTEDLPF